MEDQVAAGIFIIDGSTFVRTDSGTLVRLDELSGSGPQGPQWPPGEQGDQGDPGTVDTSICETRHQTDVAILASRPVSNLSIGANVLDYATHTIRNIVGQNGLQAFIYMDPTDPEHPQNNALMIDGIGISGGGMSTDVATCETTTFLKQFG